MKRAYIIAIMVFALLSSWSLHAAPPPNSRCPDNSNPITINNDPTAIKKINDAFKDYTQYPKGQIYELCFTGSDVTQQMDLTIKKNQMEPALSRDYFLFETKQGESHEVHIKGLQLKNDDISTAILHIINYGAAKIVLKDISFTNVKNGLAIVLPLPQIKTPSKIPSGKQIISPYIKLLGTVEIIGSFFTGDVDKSGPCITVNAVGTVLDGVTATNCKEGVSVKAENVLIKNSEIYANSIGVHIYDNAINTDIQSSKIYANKDDDETNFKRTDGVRIDTTVKHATSLYEVIDNKFQEAKDSEDIYNFGDRKPYIRTPVSETETQPYFLEFFISGDKECPKIGGLDPRKQPCDLPDNVTPFRVKIDPVELIKLNKELKNLEIDIPQEATNKTVVVMYTDPKLGTAGISQQFTTKDRRIALIATPYDIPSSGVTEPKPKDPGDEFDGSDTGGGGDDTVENKMDAGGETPSLGATAGIKCNLSPNAKNISIASSAAELWWIIFAITLLASLRTAPARIKKHE